MKPLTTTYAMYLVMSLFSLSKGSAILHAQEKEWQPQPLVLRKGNQSVTIPVGDWVVAADASDRVIVSGKLVGLHNGDLVILHYGDPRTVTPSAQGRVPLNRIHTLYHGEARRIGYYARRGCGRGILWGATIGSLLGFYIASSDDSAGPAPLWAMPLVLSAVTSPAGLVVGLIMGSTRAERAIPYRLSDNEWKIEMEVAP